MKKIFTLLILMTQAALASEPLQGEVVQSTGLLYRAGWKTCEIEILKQAEKETQFNLKLQTASGQRTFEKTLTLTKGGRVGLEKLVYDFGNLEPEKQVKGTHIYTQYQHLLIMSDSRIKYIMLYHEFDKGFYSATSELQCEIKL